MMLRCLILLVCMLPFARGVARAQAEPEDTDDTQEDSEPARADVGSQPGTLQTGNLVISRTSAPEADTTTAAHTDDWAFTFHGYVRAPVRLGLGPGVPGGNGTKLHVPPQVPDSAYTDYRYTNNLGGPWAELQFHYGNQRAAAHVIMGAYNFSEAGYRDLQAQLGISQAFVTLSFPRALGSVGGLTWNVGGFMNSYGAPGRYDGGRYDTYLFGRTHIAGETLTATLDLSDRLALTLEHGVGARLQAQPLNRTGIDLPPYLPYAGDPKYGQQASTLVHHAHAGLSYRDMVTFAAHYLTTWSDDAQGTEKDGRVTVTGAEVKLIGGVFGDGYIGYAHAQTRNIMRLAPSLEFMHSYTGYNLRDNFFPGSDTGSGTIDTILFQYTYSVASLLRYPEKFWGQGPDVLLGLFGTVSWVDSDEKTNDSGDVLHIPKVKSKFGGDVTYTMLPYLGASLRYDVVQPNMRNNTSAFSVLSPKLIFRTEYVTHEQVVVQYSHYFNKSKVDPAWPNTGLAPDENVFAVTASIWW